MYHNRDFLMTLFMPYGNNKIIDAKNSPNQDTFKRFPKQYCCQPTSLFIYLQKIKCIQS